MSDCVSGERFSRWLPGWSYTYSKSVCLYRNAAVHRYAVVHRGDDGKMAVEREETVTRR